MAKKQKKDEVASAVEPQTATATTEAKKEEAPKTSTAKPKRNAFGFVMYEGGIGHGDAK